MPHLTLLLALAFAAAPVFVPFDGFDPNLYPVPQRNPPVQPAGWAFAIWGPIYLWLILGAGVGLWKKRDAPSWQAYRAPLCLSLAVGTVWLSVAERSPVWATVLIWVMLVTAIIAYLRTPRRDRGFAQGPVGLYAGWLTAASSVSVGLLLAGYGVLGALLAAYVALCLALGIGALVQWRRPGAGYPAGIAWALVGIAAQNAGLAPGLMVISGAAALGFAFWSVKGLRGRKTA